MKNIRSPINYLQDQILGAQFTSAPEKEILCAKERDNFSITCAFVDEPDFRIRVRLTNDNTPEIVMPIGALEYLWAFSRYSWVLTQEYSAAQRKGQTQFDCVGNPRLAQSYNLLQWALDNMKGSGQGVWPISSPRPRAISEDCNEDERVANEIFLCALSWMLHHERGHIVLRHPFVNSILSLQEEREADKFATDWLLDGLPSNDPKQKKRFFCLTVGILCLQSLEVDQVACLSSTHPAAYERVFENTSAYECGTDEIIEATCTVILKFLFQEKGLTADIEGENFTDIMADLLLGITRLE